MAQQSMLMGLLKTPSQVRQEQQEKLAQDAYSRSQQMITGGGTTALPGIISRYGAQAAQRGAMAGAGLLRGVAGGLGTAVGGETGQRIADLGVTAEERQAGVGQRIISKYDLTNPDEMAKAAKELSQNNFTTEGQALALKAQQLKIDMAKASQKRPSSVREFEYYQTLSPEEQKTYQSLKRQTNSIKDLGDELALVDNATGEIIARFPKQLPPEARPETQAAQEQEKGLAVSDVDIVTNAPSQLDTYNNILSKVESLKDHSGLDIATGTSSMLPLIPGTPANDFNALLESVKGAAFLEQFEKLKGGGQITEVEGKKATDALAALERSQSKKQFVGQLNIVLDIMKQGQSRLQGKLEKAQTRTEKRTSGSKPSNVVKFSDLPE